MNWRSHQPTQTPAVTTLTYTHTYKDTIHTKHSLSTHLVTSSTERDYCYVSARYQKSMSMLRTVGCVKQLSGTKAKLIKEDPIKHGLLQTWYIATAILAENEP